MDVDQAQKRLVLGSAGRDLHVYTIGHAEHSAQPATALPDGGAAPQAEGGAMQVKPCLTGPQVAWTLLWPGREGCNPWANAELVVAASPAAKNAELLHAWLLREPDTRCHLTAEASRHA